MNDKLEPRTVDNRRSLRQRALANNKYMQMDATAEKITGRISTAKLHFPYYVDERQRTVAQRKHSYLFFRTKPSLTQKSTEYCLMGLRKRISATARYDLSASC